MGKPSGRIVGLDGLRGVSILLVVLSHVVHSTAAAFGVEVFFVISGFIITWLLTGEEVVRGTFDTRAFYLRRAFRILPPILVYLTTVAVLGITLSDIAPALFFYKNYTSGPAEVGHFWSLSIEEQFYFVWPLFLLLVRPSRRRIIVCCVLLALAPVWRQVNYHLYTAAAVNVVRTDFRYDTILTGCVLALLHRSGISPAKRLSADWMSVIIIGVVAFTLSDLGGRLPGYIAFSYMTIRNVGVALIVNRLLDESDAGWIPRILRSRPLTFVGMISFSLYLWQQLFCLRYPATWPLSFVAAIASYYLIEVPFRRAASSFRQARSPSLRNA